MEYLEKLYSPLNQILELLRKTIIIYFDMLLRCSLNQIVTLF